MYNHQIVSISKMFPANQNKPIDYFLEKISFVVISSLEKISK